MLVGDNKYFEQSLLDDSHRTLGRKNTGWSDRSFVIPSIFYGRTRHDGRGGLTFDGHCRQNESGAARHEE